MLGSKRITACGLLGLVGCVWLAGCAGSGSQAECAARQVPCLRGEEDVGFCPCNLQTNPCPNNSCVFGVCSASGDPCSASEPCVQLVCEYYAGYTFGGCVFAKNCGLKEGFHCPI